MIQDWWATLIRWNAIRILHYNQPTSCIHLTKSIDCLKDFSLQMIDSILTHSSIDVLRENMCHTR